MEKFSFDFKYNDEDYKSVFDYGDFLKKSCMCMRESDKKWDLVCRLDTIQNTLHTTPQVYAKSIENVANDLGKHLTERPFDSHFIIEKKQE